MGANVPPARVTLSMNGSLSDHVRGGKGAGRVLSPGISRPASRPPVGEHATARGRSAAPALSTPARSASRPTDPSDPKWDLLLLCVAGYLLTAVGRVHQLFPALDLLRPAMLTGALAILLYLRDPRPERRASHLALPTTKYLFALLFWMVLSIPGSLSQSTSFEMVFDNFVKTVLMYVVAVGAVRGIRDVERLAATYLVAAIVYASVVIARFDPGAGPDWRLGRLYYYDANDLATFLVTAMPFGLYFLHNAQRRLARVLTAVALAVLTVAFVRTGSRGGFIALVAMAGFIVVRYSAIPLRRRVAATVLVAGVVMATASDQYWEQMGTIMSDADYNRTDETGRMQIWSRGLDYMLQYPLLGVGPNNFPVAEGRLSPFADRQQFGVGVRWSAAHNAYIQVGAELGVIGLVLFVAVIASAFVALRRSGPRDRTSVSPTDRHTQLAQVLSASLIGYVVGAFFLSLAYSDMLYTLIALAVGLQKVTGGPSRDRY
jgi:probable O-glycosylation ligase (exosortase A-associated)